MPKHRRLQNNLRILDCRHLFITPLRPSTLSAWCTCLPESGNLILLTQLIPIQSKLISRERGEREDRGMKGSRSSSNSKQGKRMEEIEKLREEPHLSGAYIRSLVKQLTSSRTKDPVNPTDTNSTVNGDGAFLSSKSSDFCNENHQPTQQKKQVRRRLHTSRPYQERLLNMAEARREIVTALKFHRAAMKQANEQKSQSEPLNPPIPQLSIDEEERKMNVKRNLTIYPSNPCGFSNYYLPPLPPSNPFSQPFMSTPLSENFNLALPDQTLGLNLNFHDFNNIDTALYQNNNNNPSIYLSSSSSSSSPVTREELVEVAPSSHAIVSEEVMRSPTLTTPGRELHLGEDENQMDEMRSIGEQHQMEWNDRLNLVTSAWWFKFLKAMEIGPEEKGDENDEDDGYHLFEEVMEFPAWLKGSDESCFEQHLDDCCSEDYFHDPALPCMDIGEIDAMDAEWLA